MVIEYGNSITFPNKLPETPRLYLAEGVCAVVDVKSALSKHWNEVTRSTATAAACAFLWPMRPTRRALRARAQSGPTFQVRRLGEFGIRRDPRSGTDKPWSRRAAHLRDRISREERARADRSDATAAGVVWAAGLDGAVIRPQLNGQR